MATFTVERQGVRLRLNQHRLGGIGAVDFALYDHGQRQILTLVTNQTEPIDWLPWDLIDGETYTLAVRLSSSGGQSVDRGIAANVETSETAVPIQPVP